jgi:DnaJ-class molecular chaperone
MNNLVVSDLCVECEGSGTLYCVDLVRCPLCKGVSQQSNSACVVCGGNGNVAVDQEEICPSCHGTGTFVDPLRQPRIAHAK